MTVSDRKAESPWSIAVVVISLVAEELFYFDLQVLVI